MSATVVNSELFAGRYTTSQRDSISNPQTGMFIYNTTTNKYNYYNGSVWGELGGGGGATRGTFTNGSLVAGVLTITHTLGLSAPYSVIVKIFRDTGVEVIPTSITGSANSVAVDLAVYQPLANTWGYIYM